MSSRKRITVREAAEELGISENRMYQLLRAGRVVGAEHFGRTWVVPSPVRVKPAKHGPSGVADRTMPDARRRRVRKAAGG